MNTTSPRHHPLHPIQNRTKKNSRNGRPGITKSDLLVINKTDLAPYAGAYLAVMEPDTLRMRSTAKGMRTQASKQIFTHPR